MLSVRLFPTKSCRMHLAACSLISDSIYEGRLFSHSDCSRRRIGLG